MNSNGQLFIELCTVSASHCVYALREHSRFCIMTWIQTRSHPWQLVKYVIVRKCDIQDVCNVKSLRVALCLTDHSLVCVKMRLVVKSDTRNRTKRLDFAKLHARNI